MTRTERVEENRILLIDNLKRCTGCDQVKSINLFYNFKRGLGGLTPRCKQCVNAYHLANPSKKSEISREENRLREQIKRSRKEAKRFGCVNTLTLQEWKDILSKNEVSAGIYKCHICKENIDISLVAILCMEHLIPLSKGGDNAKENVAPAHRFCNNAKSNKTLEEFLEFCTKVLNGSRP